MDTRKVSTSISDLEERIETAILKRYAQFIEQYEEKNNFTEKYNGLSRYGFAGICALVAHAPFALGYTVEAFIQGNYASQILSEASLFMTFYSAGILLPAWWRAHKEFSFQQKYECDINTEIARESDARIRALGNVILINSTIQISTDDGQIREAIEQRLFPYDKINKYARTAGKMLRFPLLLTALGFLGKAVYDVFQGVRERNNVHFFEAGASLQYALGFFLTTNALYFSDANPAVYGRK